MSCDQLSCWSTLANGIRGRKQLLWSRKRLWVGEVRDRGWTKVGSGKMVSLAQISSGLGRGQIGSGRQRSLEGEQRVFPTIELIALYLSFPIYKM